MNRHSTLSEGWEGGPWRVAMSGRSIPGHSSESHCSRNMRKVAYSYGINQISHSDGVPWDRLRCEVYGDALIGIVSMERPEGV